MILDRALSVISITLWVLLLLYAGFQFAVNYRRAGIAPALRALLSVPIAIVLVLAVAVALVSQSTVFVPPQDAGVVVSVLAPEGIRDRPFRGGLRWVVPLFEDVYLYPLYWQTYTMSSKPLEGDVPGDDSITARTSDGQEVSIDCSVIFQIDPEQAIRVHLDWQKRYIEDFVRPVTRGVVRTLVSQYTVDEVNSSKRKDMEAEIDRNIRATLEEKGFILDRFILRNISFSPEYAAAVEQKQVALQMTIEGEYQAERIRKLAQGEADGVLIRAQAEADATRKRAAAQADALQAINEAISQNPDLLTYEYIDKLSPNIQVMLVPNNAPLLLSVPSLSPVEAAAAASAAPTEAAPVTPTP